jgi:hypothetical protein
MKLRATLAVAVLLVACSPSSPGESSPAGSGSAPGAVDSPYATAEILDALADPSWERLAAVTEELDAEADTTAGLVDALGEEVVGWLTDERSAAMAAALEAAEVAIPDQLPARHSDEPVAAAGPMTALGGEAFIGSVLTGSIGLDAMLNRIGESGTRDIQPLEHTSEQTHGDLRTVQTTTVNLRLTVSGSTVTSEADATQESVSTNTQTGAEITRGTYRSHITATLNACPDVNGIVTLDMVVEQSTGHTGSLGSASWQGRMTSQTQGQVGEDAWLQSETEISEMEATTTASDGTTRTGTTSVSMTTQRGPNGTRSARVTAVNGTDAGTMSGDERVKWNTFLRMVGFMVSGRGFDKAQELWRGGKCVRVEATESSRQVQRNEVVDFTAEPWHQIDGVRLEKPIVATLGGVASVEPEGAPQDPAAAVTYRAGSEQGDVGTVTLTSTSNRGIGTLELRFRVGGDYHLDGTYQNAFATGTARGEKCDGGLDGEWIIDGEYTAGGFYTGTQRWTITLTEATMTGTFTYSDLQVGAVPGAPRTEGQAAGTVTATEDEEGDVHMHLTETSHSFHTVTTAPAGGGGHDQNAPLQDYDFIWELGDDC